MIRVLIVDGQDGVRRGLRMRLDLEPDITIIGETGKTGEALYLAQAHDPDVIVVDIAMHGEEGLMLVEHLRTAVPAAAIVVLTLRGDENTRARAREAGAQVFLEKCGGSADLLQAIRQLAPCLPGSEKRHQPAGNVTAGHGPDLARTQKQVRDSLDHGDRGPGWSTRGSYKVV